MSDSNNENFESWQPPRGGGSSSPLEPNDKLWLFSKLFLIFLAEAGNWLLHTSNYALVNTVGADLFILDVLGLPDISALSNISVGTLINGVLGLAAVMTPVFLFGSLLDRHQEIFADKKAFFTGLNAIVTGLLVLLYIFVITTEFATLYMRIQEETAPSVIPEFASNQASFWPMMIMSIALIITNAAMGLATAHIIRTTKRTLKGE